MHRYAHGVVCFFYGGVGQALAFGTHDDGKVGLRFQVRMINGDGLVGERHRHRLEAILFQGLMNTTGHWGNAVLWQ